MLKETQTPIGDIAGMCGFESDGYLKELFRRRFGCSMRDWRKTAR
ncbi:MAG: helix-turn-helix transcriptional regulator [Kiritimatiellae bacterium]|nr:helix-turn-helix transcriptional regulator [Kiritimatiellia bacterium]